MVNEATIDELQADLERRRAEAGITADDLHEQERRILQPRIPAPSPVPQDFAETDQETKRQEMLRQLTVVFEGRDRYKACHVTNYKCETPEQDAAIASIKTFARNIVEFVSDGAGVVFFGPPGTGKDHLMAFLIQIAVRAGKTAIWRNGMDLFGEVRDRMDEDRSSERSFVNRLITPDVLAISDPLPPFGELSEFQAAMLFRIIDGRYARRKSTWVTLNVENSTEGRKRLGSQSIDRLTDGALVIPCNWPSYRKPR